MFPRAARLIALVAPALLAGCGTYNGGVDSVHQPVVQRTDYALDLAAGYDGLAPGEAQRLAGWLQAMRVGYGDTVAVDDSGAGGAAREQVAAEAGRYGLLLARETPVTPGLLAPGTVRVVVTRMNAFVPGCPDHSREYQPDFSASTSSNYGCAVNSNLAAMIANPADLVRGQPGAAAQDPAVAAKAIKSLRDAEPTGKGGLPGGTTSVSATKTTAGGN